MKKIEITKEMNLVETPLDETNVMVNKILGSLFDEGRYEEQENESVGFICGYPSYACYSENELYISHKNIRGGTPFRWFNTIVERLTGNDYEDVSTSLLMGGYNVLDENTGLVLTFSVKSDHLIVRFYAKE